MHLFIEGIVRIDGGSFWDCPKLRLDRAQIGGGNRSRDQRYYHQGGPDILGIGTDLGMGECQVDSSAIGDMREVCG